MTPQRTTNGTLTDLLDRVLDKGLVIHADVIVSVAGIPLIGVNLRAALAGMETMLKYGMMQAWDENSRAWELEHRKKKGEAVTAGEKTVLRMLGAVYMKEGLYAAWRYACFYLTDEKLLLYHQDFNKILFEVALSRIQGLFVRDGDGGGDGRVRDELHLLLDGGATWRLTAIDVRQLKEAIEKEMERAGIRSHSPPARPPVGESFEGQETETCPQCGKRALIRKLLEEGCDVCGWVSPTKRGEIRAIEAVSASPEAA
jgi:hypothetical protein